MPNANASKRISNKNSRKNRELRRWLPWILVAILGVALLAVFTGWNPFNTKAQTEPAPTEPPVAPTEPIATEAPTAAPTEPSVATEAPLVEEPVIATTEAPAPVAPVSCNTPSIKAGLNAADIEFGEYLDTNLGKRITFTSRKVVVPAKAWNDPLTSTELKSVETTWQSVQVCIPSEMVGRVFASGFEQGAQRYENGVIMTLEPGRYNFKLRNGEVVIWYPEQGMFVKADLERIIAQIKVGNFDIKAPLAFFGVTPDILPNIPADLVKERNVQLIQFPEPNVK